MISYLSLLLLACCGLVLLLVACGLLLWRHGRDSAELRAKTELAHTLNQIENLDATLQSARRFFGF